MNTRTAMLALGAVLLVASAGASVIHQTQAFADPQITEASPRYGDVLQTLPEFFHLCFSEPVKVEQSTDWRFDVRSPDGRALGLRIVFLPSGDCVDVFPGAPEEPPNGIWKFDWRVHAQADNSAGSGVIKFQLGELQPGETPLVNPYATALEPSGGSDGGGVSTGLLLAAGAVVTLIVMAGVGFAISRRRA